ncbi:ABC transporter permease [Arcicella rosea]|uniref:Putative permease n=1 Tax=Arcicella rosea TaxID=502909 RepID=A0A841EQV5_9BACT|nr:ABC transporter permease [Arcicella rosea]MBB6005316.1 putative permease [Arcicella rosea]
MLTNYIKIAFRNLLRNKSYAFINIAGLSLGLTCAMLIFALVRYHFSIDKHHSKYENTYRIVSEFVSREGGENFHSPGVPYPLGKAVLTDFPNIENLSMTELAEDYFEAIPSANGEDKKFKETGEGAFVEPSFFKIFDYEWIQGGFEELKNPNTVVISEKNALKYFSTTDVIGKIIKHDGRLNLKIVGVFKDYKDNTDFAYEVMPSYASLKEYYGSINDNFGSTNSSTRCVVSLNEKFTKANWDKLMPAFVKKYRPDEAKYIHYVMQPLKEIHFSEDYGGINKNLILSLFAIGIFLIITASINFVNLATAQALKRSKEVGVRKVLGSSKAQLFWQFMAETAMITITSLLISIVLFQFGEKIAREYLDGAFRFTFYFDASVILYVVLIILAVIVLSGAYPALVLAGFQPVMALKGKISTQQVGGFSVRRSLVVVQFAISQMLIIGMAVVTSQLSYFQNKDLGFKKESILTISLPFMSKQDVVKMNTFKNLASAVPDVEKISFSMSGPPQSGWVNSTSLRFDNRGEDEKWSTHVKSIDANYLDLYGIKLVAGRNLYPSDSIREVVVNEAFAKKLNFKDPAKIIGKKIEARGRKVEIVGVVKDFHQQSLSQTIEPLYMTTLATNYYSVNVKLRSANFQKVIKTLEKSFNQVYPESYFNHQFVDEAIQAAYQEEETMGKLINFFALVAILIGCLGLYGLVSFMAAQKTKEIGIRKVLGASIGNILMMFGKEFAQLIIIAFVIAAPAAWWIMNAWLQNYEYRISIGAGIFLLSIATTILIASITVGYRSVRASLANPVKSLRTE